MALSGTEGEEESRDGGRKEKGEVADEKLSSRERDASARSRVCEGCAVVLLDSDCPRTVSEANRGRARQKRRGEGTR